MSSAVPVSSQLSHTLRSKRKPHQSPLLPLPPPLLPLSFQNVWPTKQSLFEPPNIRGNVSRTHHPGLELWRFPVKNVCRLDSIFNYSDGAIEETHEMAVKTNSAQRWLCYRLWATLIPSCLALFILQNFSIFASDRNQELVDRHASIDGDFASKQRFNVMLLRGWSWRQ
jgi:hypothetical protein